MVSYNQLTCTVVEAWKTAKCRGCDWAFGVTQRYLHVYFARLWR